MSMVRHYCEMAVRAIDAGRYVEARSDLYVALTLAQAEDRPTDIMRRVRRSYIAQALQALEKQTCFHYGPVISSSSLLPPLPL